MLFDAKKASDSGDSEVVTAVDDQGSMFIRKASIVVQKCVRYLAGSLSDFIVSGGANGALSQKLRAAAGQVVGGLGTTIEERFDKSVQHIAQALKTNPAICLSWVSNNAQMKQRLDANWSYITHSLTRDWQEMVQSDSDYEDLLCILSNLMVRGSDDYNCFGLRKVEGDREFRECEVYYAVDKSDYIISEVITSVKRTVNARLVKMDSIDPASAFDDGQFTVRDILEFFIQFSTHFFVMDVLNVGATQVIRPVDYIEGSIYSGQGFSYGHEWRKDTAESTALFVRKPDEISTSTIYANKSGRQRLSARFSYITPKAGALYPGENKVVLAKGNDLCRTMSHDIAVLSADFTGDHYDEGLTNGFVLKSHLDVMRDFAPDVFLVEIVRDPTAATVKLGSCAASGHAIIIVPDPAVDGLDVGNGPKARSVAEFRDYLKGLGLRVTPVTMPPVSDEMAALIMAKRRQAQESERMLTGRSSTAGVARSGRANDAGDDLGVVGIFMQSFVYAFGADNPSAKGGVDRDASSKQGSGKKKAAARDTNRIRSIAQERLKGGGRGDRGSAEALISKAIKPLLSDLGVAYRGDQVFRLSFTTSVWKATFDSGQAAHLPLKVRVLRISFNSLRVCNSVGGFTTLLLPDRLSATEMSSGSDVSSFAPDDAQTGNEEQIDCRAVQPSQNGFYYTYKKKSMDHSVQSSHAMIASLSSAAYGRYYRSGCEEEQRRKGARPGQYEVSEPFNHCANVALYDWVGKLVTSHGMKYEGVPGDTTVHLLQVMFPRLDLIGATILDSVVLRKYDQRLVLQFTLLLPVSPVNLISGELQGLHDGARVCIRMEPLLGRASVEDRQGDSQYSGVACPDLAPLCVIAIPFDGCRDVKGVLEIRESLPVEDNPFDNLKAQIRALPMKDMSRDISRLETGDVRASRVVPFGGVDHFHRALTSSFLERFCGRCGDSSSADNPGGSLYMGGGSGKFFEKAEAQNAQSVMLCNRIAEASGVCVQSDVVGQNRRPLCEDLKKSFGIIGWSATSHMLRSAMQSSLLVVNTHVKSVLSASSAAGNQSLGILARVIARDPDIAFFNASNATRLISPDNLVALYPNSGSLQDVMMLGEDALKGEAFLRLSHPRFPAPEDSVCHQCVSSLRKTVVTSLGFQQERNKRLAQASERSAEAGGSGEVDWSSIGLEVENDLLAEDREVNHCVLAFRHVFANLGELQIFNFFRSSNWMFNCRSSSFNPTVAAGLCPGGRRRLPFNQAPLNRDSFGLLSIVKQRSDAAEAVRSANCSVTRQNRVLPPEKAPVRKPVRRKVAIAVPSAAGGLEATLSVEDSPRAAYPSLMGMLREVGTVSNRIGYQEWRRSISGGVMFAGRNACGLSSKEGGFQGGSFPSVIGSERRRTIAAKLGSVDAGSLTGGVKGSAQEAGGIYANDAAFRTSVVDNGLVSSVKIVDLCKDVEGASGDVAAPDRDSPIEVLIPLICINLNQGVAPIPANIEALAQEAVGLAACEFGALFTFQKMLIALKGVVESLMGMGDAPEERDVSGSDRCVVQISGRGSGMQCRGATGAAEAFEVEEDFSRDEYATRPMPSDGAASSMFGFSYSVNFPGTQAPPVADYSPEQLVFKLRCYLPTFYAPHGAVDRSAPAASGVDARLVKLQSLITALIIGYFYRGSKPSSLQDRITFEFDAAALLLDVSVCFKTVDMEGFCEANAVGASPEGEVLWMNCCPQVVSESFLQHLNLFLKHYYMAEDDCVGFGIKHCQCGVGVEGAESSESSSPVAAPFEWKDLRLMIRPQDPNRRRTIAADFFATSLKYTAYDSHAPGKAQPLTRELIHTVLGKEHVPGWLDDETQCYEPVVDDLRLDGVNEQYVGTNKVSFTYMLVSDEQQMEVMVDSVPSRPQYGKLGMSSLAGGEYLINATADNTFIIRIIHIPGFGYELRLAYTKDHAAAFECLKKLSSLIIGYTLTREIQDCFAGLHAVSRSMLAIQRPEDVHPDYLTHQPKPPAYFDLVHWLDPQDSSITHPGQCMCDLPVIGIRNWGGKIEIVLRLPVNAELSQAFQVLQAQALPDGSEECYQIARYATSSGQRREKYGYGVVASGFDREGKDSESICFVCVDLRDPKEGLRKLVAILKFHSNATDVSYDRLGTNRRLYSAISYFKGSVLGNILVPEINHYLSDFGAHACPETGLQGKVGCYIPSYQGSELSANPGASANVVRIKISGKVRHHEFRVSVVGLRPAHPVVQRFLGRIGWKPFNSLLHPARGASRRPNATPSVDKHHQACFVFTLEESIKMGADSDSRTGMTRSEYMARLVAMRAWIAVAFVPASTAFDCFLKACFRDLPKTYDALVRNEAFYLQQWDSLLYYDAVDYLLLPSPELFEGKVGKGSGFSPPALLMAPRRVASVGYLCSYAAHRIIREELHLDKNYGLTLCGSEKLKETISKAFVVHQYLSRLVACLSSVMSDDDLSVLLVEFDMVSDAFNADSDEATVGADLDLEFVCRLSLRKSYEDRENIGSTRLLLKGGQSQTMQVNGGGAGILSAEIRRDTRSPGASVKLTLRAVGGVLRTSDGQHLLPPSEIKERVDQLFDQSQEFWVIRDNRAGLCGQLRCFFLSVGRGGVVDKFFTSLMLTLLFGSSTFLILSTVKQLPLDVDAFVSIGVSAVFMLFCCLVFFWAMPRISRKSLAGETDDWKAIDTQEKSIMPHYALSDVQCMDASTVGQGELLGCLALGMEGC